MSALQWLGLAAACTVWGFVFFRLGIAVGRRQVIELTGGMLSGIAANVAARTLRGDPPAPTTLRSIHHNNHIS